MTKLLVVKLSDIGDVLTATPALRALRRHLPEAHITALVPPQSREVLEDSPFIDELLVFEKAHFDTAREALRPSSLALGVGLWGQLRRAHYDSFVLLHHLTTRWGALKYAALAWATRAPVRAGLENGRGWFLTHRAPDRGFGGRHEVEYWLEVVGLLGVPPDYGPLAFCWGPAEDQFAEEHLPSPKERPLVALHPGTGDHAPGRRWPLARFAVVAQRLAQQGAALVLVGGPQERGLARELTAQVEPHPIDLTGKTTLKQLGAVLRRCQAFLGNDSGVMHLATAVGTPVVALFGPSNPLAWGPWTGGESGKASVVRADLPCVPCLYTGGRVGNRHGCALRSCLTAIEPEAVVRAVQEMLEN